MNRQSLENMRMDRRLAGRGGWISRADLERESEGLPDASGKIAEEEAEPNPDESEAATPEADPQMPG
jgi:hypothetical protein